MKLKKKILASISVVSLLSVSPLIPISSQLTITEVLATSEISETSEITIEDIKLSMLESTPIIESQFLQIPEKTWLTYADEANNLGLDAEAIYNWALEDYHTAFEPAIAYYRKTLVENYNINEESLDLLSDQDLLWIEYRVWQNNGGQEDLETFADTLVAEYGVEFDVVDEKEYLTNLKQTMLVSTPITSEQFDAIQASSWLAYSERVNEEGGDPSTVYNWAVSDFPEVFQETINYIRMNLVNNFDLNEESLNEVTDIELLWEEFIAWADAGGVEDFYTLAERLIAKYDVVKDEEPSEDEEIAILRQGMLDGTPITANQFDAISRETWLAYIDRMYEEMADPATVFNWALADYPQVFQSTVNYIRNELVNKYHLDRESLNNRVNNNELLWEEYLVWLNNKEENFELLSRILVQEYGVRKTPTTVPEESSQTPTPTPTLPNTGEEADHVTYIAIAIVTVIGIVLLVRDSSLSRKDS